MSGQPFATILAQTDPFDVAQGLERYIRTLSGAQVRGYISDASPRLNDWYRQEFVPLLDERDDQRLKRAFAHTLKSNLRAIPLFGAAFCEGVILQIPADRAVGLGEEARRWPAVRPAAVAIVGAALLLGGATAQHIFSQASATAQTPVVLMTPVPLPSAALGPPKHSVKVAIARTRTPAPVRPQTQAPRPAVTPQAEPPAPAAPAAPAVHAAPVFRPSVRRVRRPPAGRGVKTIVVDTTPAPTPSPQTIDVSDMPRSYSDATPLPAGERPPKAEVPTPQSVPTPTPGINRSWTHRLVRKATHLIYGVDPFRPHGHPSPSPSPIGPQPR